MARRGRLIGRWDGRAAGYEQKPASIERRQLADSRRGVGERAAGLTLELAVGTGLNFRHYPAGVRLIGFDWSDRMVRTAARSSRPQLLARADAMALPFAAASFDSVVCTFALCCVPDERAALTEAVRVLRPGGRLLLELVTIPLQGEHYTRRPLTVVRELGLTVVDTERLSHGIIERVHARR
jgi:ubiquinone/menaquinone biosynthesis C-methylase UbiE